ncbi:MAG TPA: hypothetical protein ENN36_09550 [Candidatus Bathyarchaeota archaeon]|nr:hypothetical protein [Candidatus Bathyarchaeota archaeon]
MEKTNKTATLILVLALTFAAIFIALPVSGQRVGNIKSYPFIGATPNPVGVEQEVLLHMGITEPLENVGQGWVGLSVTIERPDGGTDTISDIKTDSTGGTGRSYTPNMVGDYYLQTHFPGQWKNFSGYNLYFESGVSPKLKLVVQDEPIPYYPGVTLPTEYWSRPIDAQFHEWSKIAGNWLAINSQFSESLAGRIVDYNEEAPESPHILWTKPLVHGGLAGGLLDDHAYHMGDAYEGFFSSQVIIGGKLFYNKFNDIGNVDNYVVSVDLHTGETLWEKHLTTPEGENVDLSFGQVMYWDSYNVHGVFEYLVAQTGGGGFFGPAGPETWHFFDPVDARWLFTMTDLPSGSNLEGPNGEIIRYTVNLQRGWITMWSSMAVIDAYWMTDPTGPGFGSWRPQGKTIDATGSCRVTDVTPLGRNGYQWNKTIQTGLPGSADYYALYDYVIGYSRSTYAFSGSAFDNPPFTFWAISLKPGEEGTLKFLRTYDAPAGNVTLGYTRYGTGDNRAFIIHIKEDGTNYGFDLDTGEPLFGPTQPPEHYLSYLETWTIIYDGKFYTFGTKGIVDCYDLYDGTRLWSYEATDYLGQILWSNNWNIRVDFIVNGKMYLRHSEHSPVDPMPRGAPYVCLNATTGDVIWRADGLFRGTDWGGHAMIGDSIIATMDTYDMRIYAIGKGPSALAVTASPETVAKGSSVMIKGIVTDVSPGTKDAALQMRFPNGVPAVSDDDMDTWMLYVYKQKTPRPENVTGVPVKLAYLLPDGTWKDIDETVSDVYGNFGYKWTPPDEGTYVVKAFFLGSKSYYGSQATTYVGVDPAAGEAPSADEIAQTTVNQLPEIPAYLTIDLVILILAVIGVVIGLIAYLALRKQ